jgi:hypothetical protein
VCQEGGLILTSAVYAPPGYVLFVNGDTPMVEG